MKNEAAIPLLVCAFLASSLLATTAYAQTAVPTPSVPEFTLKLTDNSYDVPTSYSKDQYTGQNVTNAGYHADNKMIEFTIKNQPFASTVNGTPYHLFYNVRVKGHFGESWTELYAFSENSLLSASDSEYTVLSISAEDYPASALVDFQVEAVIGYHATVYSTPEPPPSNAIKFYPWQTPNSDLVANDRFFLQLSDWSNTQTITMPDTSSPSISPTTELSPTPNNTQENFTSTAIIIGLAITVAVLVGLLIYFKKIKK
jgi:hypothetical protein